MRVFLVRHGQTDSNVNKERFGGRVDVPLNDKGREEARELREEFEGITFDRVYSSPLIRAFETARILYDGDIIVDERLIERSNGDLEGRLRSEIDPRDINYKSKVFIDKYHIEPDEEIMNRVKSFMDDLSNLDGCENVLIVTHAGTGMYIRYYLDGEPEDKDVLQYKLGNCKKEEYSLEKGKKFVKICPASKQSS